MILFEILKFSYQRCGCKFRLGGYLIRFGCHRFVAICHVFTKIFVLYIFNFHERYRSQFSSYSSRPEDEIKNKRETRVAAVAFNGPRRRIRREAKPQRSTCRLFSRSFSSRRTLSSIRTSINRSIFIYVIGEKLLFSIELDWLAE